MSKIYLKITQNSYTCDSLLITEERVGAPLIPANATPTKLKFKTSLDGISLHYFLQELNRCDNCRKNFIHSFPARINRIQINLTESDKGTIDYNWNEKITLLLQERCELDHALSWLSTLGGAFSALGDYYLNMAETAGRISYHQLQLAMRIGDPNVASRCKLYFSLSLIQRRRFKLARDIIKGEYQRAIGAVVRDERLVKMCLGIWEKLRYEMWTKGRSVHKRCC